MLIGLLFSLSTFAATAQDAESCSAFIREGTNYRVAQTYAPCLRAAASGSGPAEYSVGMGYGFAGQPKLEEIYYRRAAKHDVSAAYLALGHLLRTNREDEAIYWYERFVDTKSQGYGYAAKELADIFAARGNTQQSQHWRKVCESSPYAGCAKKHGT